MVLKGKIFLKKLDKHFLLCYMLSQIQISKEVRAKKERRKDSFVLERFEMSSQVT